MFSGSQKPYISTYFQLSHFDSPVPRPVGLENTFLEHKPCHFQALFFTVEVKCFQKPQVHTQMGLTHKADKASPCTAAGVGFPETKTKS